MKHTPIDLVFRNKLENYEPDTNAPDFNAFLTKHKKRMPKKSLAAIIWRRLLSKNLKWILLSSVFVNLFLIGYIIFKNQPNNATAKVIPLKSDQPLNTVSTANNAPISGNNSNEIQTILNKLSEIDSKLKNINNNHIAITDTFFKTDTFTIIQKQTPEIVYTGLAPVKEYKVYEVDTKPRFSDELNRMLDLQELAQYIKNNLRYQKIPDREKTDIRIQVQFKVLSDNNIVDIKVQNNNKPALENEIIMAIKSIKTWEAGKVKGEAVNTLVNYSVSLQFEKNTPFPKF